MTTEQEHAMDWTLDLDRYEPTPDRLHESYEWYTFGDRTVITAEERAPFARVEAWAPVRARVIAREYDAGPYDHLFVTVHDHNGEVVFEREFWMDEEVTLS